MDLSADARPRPTCAPALARYVVDHLQPLEAAFEGAHGLPDGHDPGPQARGRSSCGCTAAPFRAPWAARAGPAWSRSWSTSSWARRRAACGRSSPARTTPWPTATPEQRPRYLDPCLRGERNGSYAITEAGQGSDARTLASTAVLDPATGEYVLNGEKWFVTGPSDTDFMIFHCHLLRGGDRLPTLFLVDYDTPGLVMSHDPDYTHTFADRHPQFTLTDVRVRPDAILGGIGEADTLTNEWFVEERLHIGARCTGAMERLLALAVEWATDRVQFGERIYDFQGVSFPLADSAADASAARLLTREAASMLDGGADPKVVHAKASLAKLFASEAAYRCADRVVQVFGGRGYMREFPAERYLRELRVDRIWEGTSEIQRVVIARALEKRGVAPSSGDEPRGRRVPHARGDRPPPPLRPAVHRRRGRQPARLGWAPRSATTSRSMGSETRIHFVNPKYAEVHGTRCWPTLESLPERPDTVILAVNPLRAARLHPGGGGRRHPVGRDPGRRRGRGRRGRGGDAAHGPRHRRPATASRSWAPTAWAWSTGPPTAPTTSAT